MDEIPGKVPDDKEPEAIAEMEALDGTPEKLEKRISRLERTVRQHTKDELDDRRGYRRLLWRNFVAGIVRGGGTIVGIALLGTLLVFLLSRLAENNSKEVSEFIAELVRWIQRSM